MAPRKSTSALLGEALISLTDEIRALRLATEQTGSRALMESMERGRLDRQMISEFGERRLSDYRLLEAIHGMTAELTALRVQRAKGGNGHAPNDTLEHSKDPTSNPSDPDPEAE